MQPPFPIPCCIAGMVGARRGSKELCCACKAVSITHRALGYVGKICMSHMCIGRLDWNHISCKFCVTSYFGPMPESRHLAKLLGGTFIGFGTISLTTWLKRAMISARNQYVKVDSRCLPDLPLASRRPCGWIPFEQCRQKIIISSGMSTHIVMAVSCPASRLAESRHLDLKRMRLNHCGTTRICIADKFSVCYPAPTNVLTMRIAGCHSKVLAFSLRDDGEKAKHGPGRLIVQKQT